MPTGHNASYLRLAVKSHQQKVKSLYKRAVRNCESCTNLVRANFLYEKALLRNRFDVNRDIKDLRKAKQLLIEGEQELYDNQHPQPMKFAYSPGGICFERYYDFPDYHLDYWHPLEKAQYPYYFARREQAKLEYLKLYEKQYGVNPEIAADVTHYQEYNEEPRTQEEKRYGPFIKPSKGAVESGQVHPATKEKARTDIHIKKP